METSKNLFKEARIVHGNKRAEAGIGIMRGWGDLMA